MEDCQMANQFYLQEEQVRDIICSLLFTSAGFTLDDSVDPEQFKRCADLAIKLRKMYGRPLGLNKTLDFDEQSENQRAKEILEAFPELNKDQ
jgi:hypothetical protein